MGREVATLSGAETDVRIVSLGNLALNLGSYRASVDGESVELTYHEFELLRLLFARSDQIVPYEALAEAIWRSSGRGAVRHLNVVVHRLRAKIAGSWPYTIETVRGRGYGLLKSREAERANG